METLLISMGIILCLVVISALWIVRRILNKERDVYRNFKESLRK